MTTDNLTAPPLRRLLKRQDAQALLAQNLALLPASVLLALVDATGELYVGEPAALHPDLSGAMRALTDDVGRMVSGRWLAGLWVERQLVGAVVAWLPDADEASHTASGRILAGLHLSISLLVERARETHTIANETLERYREINLLYRLGAAISTSLDPIAIADRVLAELQHTVRARIGAVLLASPNADDPIAQTVDDLDVSATCGHRPSVSTLCTLARDAISDALATGQSYIVTPPGSAERDGIASILCAPLRAQENSLGVLLLGRLAQQDEFTAGDSKLVSALAAHLAYALETARFHQEEVDRQRIDRELAISRAIQMSLLPAHAPSAPGWQFAAKYRPAREVGGDHYDFVMLPDQPASLGIVIADVTGKGMPAALFMAFSRTVIRLESMRGQGPAIILERANQFITQEVGARLFLSAFCANLDMETGHLRFANAGHDWPIWSRYGLGMVCELDVSGKVLGAFSGMTFDENEVRLEPGDTVVLFTDGITEARNEAGEFFGEVRLKQAIMADPDAAAEQVAAAILRAVDQFIGAREQNDDMTLVVIRRTPAPSRTRADDRPTQ